MKLTNKDKKKRECEKKRQIVLKQMSDFTRPMVHLLKDPDVFTFRVNDNLYKQSTTNSWDSGEKKNKQ